MAVTVTNYDTVNGKIRTKWTGERPGSQAVFHDPLGSVVGIYEDGWLKADRVYDASGETRAEWNDVGTFGWVGGYGYRETRREWVSHYVRARHYSYMTGGWTSVDPLWPGEMAYGYVDGRITKKVDYLGSSTATWSATASAKGNGPCSASNRNDLLTRLDNINAGQSPSNQINPTQLQNIIRSDKCCQALMNATDQFLDYWGNKYSGSAYNESQLLSYIEKSLFCLMCRETSFIQSNCEGVHNPDTGSAAGLFGFVGDGKQGNFLQMWGTGNSDVSGLLKSGYRAQIQAGVHGFCALACQRTPGCQCNAWNNRGKPRQIVGGDGWTSPWPNNIWPYLPGPGASQNPGDFADCLASFGLNTTPPWAAVR